MSDLDTLIEQALSGLFSGDGRMLTGFVLIVDQIMPDGQRQAETFTHADARSWEVAGLARFAAVNADHQLIIPSED